MKRILAFVLLLSMLLALAPVSACADGAWKKNGSGWWYQNEDGSYPVACWQKINGKWYYFNQAGYMQTGWQQINGTWYYLSSSGAMQTGWVKSGKSWYYLDGSGAMQTGWVKSSGKWYYLKASGAMQTGWLKDGGEWYYLNSSGAMETGWEKIGGKWFYFNSSGAMLTGWQYINGTWYELDYYGGYTEASQPPAGYQYTEENYQSLYQPILDKYVNYCDLLAEYGYQNLRWFDYGVSEHCNYCTFIGYLIQDIDGNGIKELIIASNDSEEYYSKIIIELHTIKNGAVEQVFQSWARSRNHYMGANQFLNEGSNGAAYTLVTVYSYSEGNMIATDGIRSSDNYTQEQPVYWYRTSEFLERYPASLRISEEEAYSLWDEWRARVIAPDLIPLASANR